MSDTPLYEEYRDGLEVAAANWFRSRQAKVNPDKPFILRDHEDWSSNIILRDVYGVVSDVRPRHAMIHHGLSSQALTFNLFGPLLVRNDWAAAQEAFQAAGVEWPQSPRVGKFEYEDREVFGESGRDQPTSWDIALGTDPAAPSILVEVKFTEHDLGQCSVYARGDCNGQNPASDFNLCYLHSAKHRRYLGLAQALGVLRSGAFNGSFCPFTVYYQFYREVMFAAAKNAPMVYVLDERNPALRFPTDEGHRGLIPFLMTTLPSQVASRIFFVTIHSILHSIEKTKRHGDWTDSFRMKYAFEHRAA